MRTDRPDGDVYADGCFGRRSQPSLPLPGFHKERLIVALAVMEVINCRKVINDRFNVDDDRLYDWTSVIHKRKFGYSIIYTNKDSINIGVGTLSRWLRSWNCMNFRWIENHPVIAALKGESGAFGPPYPWSGYNSVRRLFETVWLLESARLVNAIHREWSEYGDGFR